MSKSKRRADSGAEPSVFLSKKAKLSVRQSKQRPAPSKQISQQPTSKNSQKPRIPIETKETETDSEPIVDSDTTSQSGEDDGVSWPSDSDEEEQSGHFDQEHDFEEEDDTEARRGIEEEDEDGGVKLQSDSLSVQQEHKASNDDVENTT